MNKQLQINTIFYIIITENSCVKIEAKAALGQEENMKYSISDIARILGITTSAVRYFEKENLISVEKDENGFRLYHVVDIFRLLSYKKYRTMGFSMKMVVKQFGGSENDRKIIQSRVEKQKQEALKKSEYYKDLADYIDEHLNSIDRIDKLLDKYEFTMSPAMTFMHGSECGWLPKAPEEQQIVHKWVDAMPATRLSVILNMKDVNKGYFAYSAPPEVVRHLSLPTKLHVEELPSTSCLHTITVSDDRFSEEPHLAFVGALEYAKKRGFEINGKPWGHILLVEVAQGARLKPYVELWIPIC